MRIVKEQEKIDAIAEPGDAVQVEITNDIGKAGHKKLYVHVNGETILRIGAIADIEDLTDRRVEEVPGPISSSHYRLILSGATYDMQKLLVGWDEGRDTREINENVIELAGRLLKMSQQYKKQEEAPSAEG